MDDDTDRAILVKDADRGAIALRRSQSYCSENQGSVTRIGPGPPNADRLARTVL